MKREKDKGTERSDQKTTGGSFTPGPWTFEKGDTYTDDGGEESYLVLGPGKCFIAEVSETGEGNALDDARLIAAAPELLEALKAMREDWLTAFDNDVAEGNPDAVKILKDVDDAITKAEGR